MIANEQNTNKAKGYDPRSVANLLLDLADAKGLSITNLALQKLLYFSHGLYLVKRKVPLVSGHFVAWQFGPVHPAVYECFKKYVDQNIATRAKKTDIISGLVSDIPAIQEKEVLAHIERTLIEYGGMTAGRLVEVSHAKNSPWHFTVSQQGNKHVYGARIENVVIMERFKYHKVSVGDEPRVGEPIEEEPAA